jgi:UDP-N-acetylmuramate dehydrogenase
MNGGSQRKSISDYLVSVVSIDPLGNIIERKKEDCGFGYRESIYKESKEIILSARFELELLRASDIPMIRRDALKILKDRRLKFPLKLPNCGSVFKSSPDVYALYGPPGKIIEDLGFKGLKIGGARVSNEHANFIVNEGGATDKDIICLINMIKKSAKDNLGITLIPEVRLVTKDLKMVDL